MPAPAQELRPLDAREPAPCGVSGSHARRRRAAPSFSRRLRLLGCPRHQLSITLQRPDRGEIAAYGLAPPIRLDKGGPRTNRHMRAISVPVRHKRLPAGARRRSAETLHSPSLRSVGTGVDGSHALRCQPASFCACPGKAIAGASWGRAGRFACPALRSSPAKMPHRSMALKRQTRATLTTFSGLRLHFVNFDYL